MKKKKAVKAAKKKPVVKQESTFFEDVWEVARLVPRSRVTSYGAIARYLGTGKSARMVGWAMNGCPTDVPAHRVVNSQGLLTGRHHFPEGKMQRLLNAEGVKVENDQVQNFERHFWDPNFELDKLM